MQSLQSKLDLTAVIFSLQNILYSHLQRKYWYWQHSLHIHLQIWLLSFFRIHYYQDACLLVYDAGTVAIYRLYGLKFWLHLHGYKVPSTLKMESPRAAETYVNSYWTARHHMLEGKYLGSVLCILNIALVVPCIWGWTYTYTEGTWLYCDY